MSVTTVLILLLQANIGQARSATNRSPRSRHEATSDCSIPRLQISIILIRLV